MAWGDLCLYLYYCAHREFKNKWGKETNIGTSARKEAAGIISLEERIWDLRGTRQGLEGGRCSLCLGGGGQNVEHTFKNEKAKIMIHSM
jgi:hypothetical protein